MHPLRWSTLPFFLDVLPAIFCNVSAECNFTPGNTFTKNPWRTPTNQTGAGLYVRHQQRRHAASALFPSVWENPMRYITSVLTLCVGLWAAFVFPRVNSPVRAVSSFPIGVLPAFWPQKGICRGIERWQYAFGSRLVQIGLAHLHKAAGSPLLAGCCMVWSFSQTQSDVLRRFRFMGVIP